MQKLLPFATLRLMLITFLKRVDCFLGVSNVYDTFLFFSNPLVIYS